MAASRRMSRGPGTPARTASRCSSRRPDRRAVGRAPRGGPRPPAAAGRPGRPRHAPAGGRHAALRQRARRRRRPFDAGLGRVVKLDKPGDFVGRAALERVAADGPAPPGRARRRGTGDRPPRLPRPRRRAADRRRHQRHAVADARRADRDGLRRTRRRGAGYHARHRDPRRARARRGSSRCRSTGGAVDVSVPDRLALHPRPRVGPGRRR